MTPKPLKNTAKISIPVNENTGEIFAATITLDFYTVADAQAFAAEFPKSWKVKPCSLSTTELYVTERYGSTEGFTIVPSSIESRYGGNITQGTVQQRAELQADGVNGGRNETGIKRLKAFTAKLAEMGIELEATTSYRNAGTLEQLAEQIN